MPHPEEQIYTLDWLCPVQYVARSMMRSPLLFLRNVSNEVVTAAVMAGDTEPIEILLHLPLLAEDKVRFVKATWSTSAHHPQTCADGFWRNEHLLWLLDDTGKLAKLNHRVVHRAERTICLRSF